MLHHARHGSHNSADWTWSEKSCFYWPFSYGNILKPHVEVTVCHDPYILLWLLLFSFLSFAVITSCLSCQIVKTSFLATVSHQSLGFFRENIHMIFGTPVFWGIGFPSYERLHIDLNKNMACLQCPGTVHTFSSSPLLLRSLGSELAEFVSSVIATKLCLQTRKIIRSL